VKTEDCPKFSNCEKLEEIKTLDPEKYDIQGLIGDICWLCDKRGEMKGEIVVICAWCGEEIDRKPGRGKSGLSHRICPRCQQKYFPTTEKLESLYGAEGEHPGTTGGKLRGIGVIKAFPEDEQERLKEVGSDGREGTN